MRIRFLPIGVLAALSVARESLAQGLGSTVNLSLQYGTIVGWGTQDLRATIMLVINILMGFLGLIAVVGVF